MEAEIPLFNPNPGLQVDIWRTRCYYHSFITLFLTVQFIKLSLSKQAQACTRNSVLLIIIYNSYCSCSNLQTIIVENIEKFLALYSSTGLMQNPTISLCWSTYYLLQTSVFNKVFLMKSLLKYRSVFSLLIIQITMQITPTQTVFYKVRAVVEYIVANFEAVYVRTLYISVNEKIITLERKIHIEAINSSRCWIKFQPVQK